MYKTLNFTREITHHTCAKRAESDASRITHHASRIIHHRERDAPSPLTPSPKACPEARGVRRGGRGVRADHASRIPLHITLLIFCTLLLIGCSSQGPQEVSFMVFGDPAEVAAYSGLVEAFEAQHPEIDILFRHIPGQGEYRRRLAADFSSGSPPDVMLLNYRRFATFADQGGVEPLGAYLAQSEVIKESDFFAPTIESFYLDGQLWCIPQNISSLVVYYNRDLFDAAGVAYPTNEWTWDDFLQKGRALSQDLDGDGHIDQYGVGIAPNIFRLAPFVWQSGGDIVDDPAQPTRLTLDTPEALSALQWLVDLQVKEGIVPDAVAESAEESESRFLNGRLAMYFNSRRGVPTYRTIKSFSWDVAPLPRNQQAAGILHSDAYCMAARTKNKEAAWSFIEFANSVAGQKLVAVSGRTVPSLKEVADSPVFLDPNQPPANSRVYIDTVPILGRVPIMTTWSAIEKTASKEIERAFYGQASVQEAARTAIELTQPYFEQANPTEASDVQTLSEESGVEGRVELGPTCGNMPTQGDVDCSNMPYQAYLTISDLNGQVVAEGPSNPDGTYRFTLPPGDYVLVPEEPQGPISADHISFSVTANNLTYVTVLYNTMIP